VKPRAAKITLVCLFMGVLFVVGLQVVRPIFPVGSKLKGMADEPPAPVWSLDTIRSGEAFRAASAWYDGHAGLRNFWVRLDNEVTYVLFTEATEHKVGTNLVVGEHDWLFERHYVKHAITPFKPDDARVRESIRHMRSVQDKLAKRGIPFLLLIAPSKVEVYPEHVPAAQLGGRDLAQVTTEYEHYKAELVAAGINLYDGPQVFLNWKKAGQRNLFARGGTHWSYASALQVLEDVRTRLNPTMRRPMPPLILEKKVTELAQLSDTDLFSLLNLLGDFPFNHPQPMPVLAPQKEVPVEQLPRIVWVHDSFGWPLIELVYNANVAQPTESFYYFETMFKVPGGVRLDTSISQLDWESYLKNKDAVVMVWTEIAFTYLGWDFFETLDAHLQ
jgi:hypothetical protein